MTTFAVVVMAPDGADETGLTDTLESAGFAHEILVPERMLAYARLVVGARARAGGVSDAASEWTIELRIGERLPERFGSYAQSIARTLYQEAELRVGDRAELRLRKRGGGGLRAPDFFFPKVVGWV